MTAGVALLCQVSGIVVTIMAIVRRSWVLVVLALMLQIGVWLAFLHGFAEFCEEEDEKDGSTKPE